MPEWPYIVEATDLPEVPQRTNIEPIDIVAGDSILFTRTLPLYPASGGWSLQYALRGVSGSAINFVSQALGDDHQVSLLGNLTAGWAPGVYSAQGYAVNGNDRHTIFEGFIRIRPNLAVEDADYDTRSHAKRVLDLIEQVMEGRATDDVLDSTIEGVVIRRLPVDQLILLRDRYRAEYKAEVARAKVKDGRATGRLIFARFSRPV